MLDVRVTYKRSSAVLQIPENWHEVSMQDAPKLLTWAYVLDPGHALLAVVEHYLPRKFVKKLDPPALGEFAHLFHWYTAGPSASAHIPMLEFNGTTYYMPEPRFMNGIAAVWPFADEFHGKIVANQHDVVLVKENLIKLAATLYREKIDGKRLGLFGRQDIRKRSKIVEQWDEMYLVNALLYFDGCKEDLHQIYGQTIFKKKDPEEDDADEEDGSNDGAYFGWWGTYMDIAESRLFGNVDEVHQTNFHSICMYLSKKYLEAEDINRKRMFNQNTTDD